MELTEEQRYEKAVQHVIVFAEYMHQTQCRTYVDCWEILAEATARLMRTEQGVAMPIKWAANEFAKEMRERMESAGIGPVLP